MEEMVIDRMMDMERDNFCGNFPSHLHHALVVIMEEIVIDRMMDMERDNFCVVNSGGRWLEIWGLILRVFWPEDTVAGELGFQFRRFLVYFAGVVGMWSNLLGVGIILIGCGYYLHYINETYKESYSG
nr:hypothetical protein [Tanacetum cinerariifolium]